VREALCQYIHSKYQVGREEILDHIETYHQGLQLDAGAKIIAKNLCTRIGLNAGALGCREW
jgi:hypothetical protein